MYVIVSDSLQNTFVQYKVVPGLKEACGLDLKELDVLVYHHSKETELNLGVWLSRIKAKYPDVLLLYINATPSSAASMAIKGAGGFYYPDEFYLADEEELSVLVEKHKSGDIQMETSLVVSSTSLDVVNGFLEDYLKGNRVVNNPVYQKRVTDAINELTVYTKGQEACIQEMSDTAMTIFSQAAHAITSLRSVGEEMKAKLDKFQEQGGTTTASSGSFANSAVSFPSYRFMGNAKVLCFREWSPTRYLTSFALAYKRYLHLNMHKRVKLVFVYTRSASLGKKYTDYTSITPEVSLREALYESDIVATNNPKKEVMEKLLKQPNIDVVLVVDRMYGTNPIVTGKVKEINVVSSRSDFERYKVKPEETITSVMDYPGCLFTIPTLSNFPIDPDTRYAVYFNTFDAAFKKINTIIGIGNGG